MALRNARIEPVPGRGLGVVATRALTFPDVVCVAQAFVTGASTLEDTLRAIVRAQLGTDARAERLLRVCWTLCPEVAGEVGARPDGSAYSSAEGFEAILRELPTDAARRTLAERGLATAHDLRTLAIKLSRNGFADGVFPEASRFNHSCRPNCLFFTRRGTPAELVIVAAEPVSAGEELTISYLPESRWHLPTDQRRLLLGRQYAFRCACRRCHRPAQPAAVRRAERTLEAMRCARCERTPGVTTEARVEVVADNDLPPGVHVPLDEHENPAGERCGGYTPCTRCGAEADEGALDQALLACHARVRAAALAGAGGSARDAAAEHDMLRALVDDGGHALCDSHWLAIEVHWRLQATSAVLLARGPVRSPSERLGLLREHALHSVALVRATEALVGARSHLHAALCARAADALDALVVAAGGERAPAVEEVSSHPPIATNVHAQGVRLAVDLADVAAVRLCAAQLRDAASTVLEIVDGRAT
ncbi:hypothetical protein KFE25_000479 [Diacronema lutheri]|uniref:SET domain-containing protein n=1 Tax=Diacronema lutheri TaxID=2081491 RepID=A0A8J5XH67_DIALT|nr:hypothetical protein KFE25_000479 [Diacronema lutheri]